MRTIILTILLAHVVVADSIEHCQSVKLSDIGWTDVTSTTAVAKQLLLALGYEPKISVLSAPVTFASLKNKDIDVFLGNWMPTQEADIRPYLDEASIIQLSQNLAGAVFTLAVPDYVFELGVKTFDDLSKFSGKFNHTIYGIEPGNDGNRLILSMINDNAYSLKNFRLVESSEQGMLTEVNNAIKEKAFIVFLAWAPHPMNLSLPVRYLSGGEQYFGPHQGESSVYTLVRRGFIEDCPNLTLLFKQIAFSVSMENELMQLVLSHQENHAEAIRSWLKKNLAVVKPWLSGVTTLHEKPAGQALENYLQQKTEPTLSTFKAPLGLWIARGVSFLTTNFSHQFRAFSLTIENIVSGCLAAMLKLHWGWWVLLFAIISYVFQRSLSLCLFVVAGLLLIVNLGLWVDTLKTLVLVILASSISIVFGVPVGILGARRPVAHAIMQPVLDLMQTIPTFVYLIPTLMLFGLGVVPGLISTVIFAIAAPIRLTVAGIKSVPVDLIEASTSFGASPLQTLLKIELPYAMPAMKEGFTQAIMLSLSMVVIAGLVGAEGLGTPVIRALNTVNIVQGFEAGVAIVIVAIILDRTLNSRKRIV